MNKLNAAVIAGLAAGELSVGWSKDSLVPTLAFKFRDDDLPLVYAMQDQFEGRGKISFSTDTGENRGRGPREGVDDSGNKPCVVLTFRVEEAQWFLRSHLKLMRLPVLQRSRKAEILELADAAFRIKNDERLSKPLRNERLNELRSIFQDVRRYDSSVAAEARNTYHAAKRPRTRRTES